MNILKKLFGKFKKKNQKKEPECWYNNFHEKKRSRWSEPIEGEALSSTNGQMDHSITNSISKR